MNMRNGCEIPLVIIDELNEKNLEVLLKSWEIFEKEKNDKEIQRPPL
jgi:hypothetical protein